LANSYEMTVRMRLDYMALLLHDIA
jgi:hypothetical protein